MYQHLILLIASYFFYWYTSNNLLILLIFVTLITYYCGNKSYSAKNNGIKKIFLAIGTIGPLLVLGYFKYFNFFLSSFSTIAGQDFNFWKIILPIGISFYTFQGLSYVFDLYRGTLKPAKSLREYALFISFFPQLVAGPIVRASEFLPQLKNKVIITPENLQFGITLILWGIFKKVVIADSLAPVVNIYLDKPIGLPSIIIIFATFLFGIQIYCDFSGYTDIAIGTARILGFRLPQNFLRPYLTQSPTEFWHRWHITLSRFIRDYLYIPLGGNRKGHIRTYINLNVTWLICGLWHGAAWNFVLWGGYHGLLLTIHKLLGKDLKIGQNSQFLNKSYAGILTKILITQYFVFLGWLIFRVGDPTNLLYCLEKFIIFDFDFQKSIQLILFIGGLILVALLYAISINKKLSSYIFHFITYDWIEYFALLNLRKWFLYVLIIVFSIFWLMPPKTPEFIYFTF
ncbi:MBOAT family O-acyltransferase [Methanochimaera problematica]|nr:MBOAT family O-acyltransferase [Methanoplanus sp. FWC-SCC4]